MERWSGVVSDSDIIKEILLSDWFGIEKVVNE